MSKWEPKKDVTKDIPDSNPSGLDTLFAFILIGMFCATMLLIYYLFWRNG